MCSWVSISVLQNLHWLSVLDPFLKLFLTGSIDALVFIMALHCFLVNFSIYSGLLPTLISFFLSIQCLIFVIVSVSFSITSITLVFISPWRCFFRHSFDITAIWSLTLSTSAILFISFLHSLFLMRWHLWWGIHFACCLFAWHVRLVFSLLCILSGSFLFHLIGLL